MKPLIPTIIGKTFGSYTVLSILPDKRYATICKACGDDLTLTRRQLGNKQICSHPTLIKPRPKAQPAPKPLKPIRRPYIKLHRDDLDLALKAHPNAERSPATIDGSYLYLYV